MHSENDGPQEGRRPVQLTRRLQQAPVENAHGDTAPEQDDREQDEQGREHPHQQSGWAVQPVCIVARVVAGEAPTGTCELDRDRRQDDEADEDVQGQEMLQAAEERAELDDCEYEEGQSDDRGCLLYTSPSPRD